MPTAVIIAVEVAEVVASTSRRAYYRNKASQGGGRGREIERDREIERNEEKG